MDEYLNIFIDKEYPKFIDKYLETKTMDRLKYVTQFCGCDYTNLYSPLFLYTRYYHSIVVAHMTWHFSHNKKETIVALLHDIGTPCFAHCIDLVFGDYIKQESSERKIIDIIKTDDELLNYLKSDNISIDELEEFSNYHILENKSPKLCTDRLDGILHTCYVWLHTHSLEEIKEVYNNMIVLENEDNYPEIGFKSVDICDKFASMVYNYAKELQGNTDKYVMKYISEIVKLSFQKKLITLNDLYVMKEKDLCDIFLKNFPSWKNFTEARDLIKCDKKPADIFCISFETKKRNSIPLVKTNRGNERISDYSEKAKIIYNKLNNYKDSQYAYIEGIYIIDRNNENCERVKNEFWR